MPIVPCEETYCDNGGEGVVRDAGGGGVCVVLVGDYAEADARLIEAAPELLASCKELLADSHGHTGDCAVWIQDEDGAVISYQAEECDCEFGAKRNRARAAIAKAEGRP